MRIVILCPDFPPDRSGLADHTAALAERLASHADVTVITSQRGKPDETADKVHILRQVPQWGWSGGRIIRRLLRQLQPDWVLVQYVPHMYGRAGINLTLPLLLCWWRWRGGKILLMLHELYIPWSLAPKRMIAAMIQRFMLVMSVAAAQSVGISTQIWQRKLQALFPFWRTKFYHLPIPSNIPIVQPTEPDRAAAREQLGIAPDELVLGFFGTLHDSKLMAYVVESLNALQTRGHRTRLLCIGPSASELARSLNGAKHQWSDRIVCTGYAEAHRVSHYLSLTDIFLLPLIDGVSSRRGSLMAALSHEVPVVATSGQGTDHLLRDSAALVLSPVNDKAAFLENVCLLASDEARRHQLSRMGGELYRDHFSWPVVIHRLLSLMEGVHESA